VRSDERQTRYQPHGLDQGVSYRTSYTFSINAARDRAPEEQTRSQVTGNRRSESEVQGLGEVGPPHPAPTCGSTLSLKGERAGGGESESRVGRAGGGKSASAVRGAGVGRRGLGWQLLAFDLQPSTPRLSTSPGVRRARGAPPDSGSAKI